MKQNNKINGSSYFGPILKRVSIVSWLLKLIPIPVGLISARLMANIVTSATNGDFSSVLINGLLILGLTLGMKSVSVLCYIGYNKSYCKAEHKCKLELYKVFLSNPLSFLFSTNHGDNMEKINDDFSMIITKSTELRPSVWVGFVTALSYLIFLGFYSPLTAICMLLISLIQLIPPIIIKRYIDQYYDDDRDLEGQLSNLTLEGFYGYDTIKLYNLKNWYLKRLRKFHKEMFKVESKCTIACAAEEALDSIVSNILHYGSYGILGFFVLKNIITFDVAVAAITLSGGLFNAVQTMFENIPELSKAKRAEKRLSDWFSNNFQNNGEFNASKPNWELQLNNVSLSFADKTIYSNLICNIDLSQTILVEGPNGNGKSTLLNLAVGILTPDKGDIKINDVSAKLFSDKVFPKDIFFLPQDDAMLSISANELFDMATECNKEIAIEYVEKFCLNESLLNTPIDSLSGGERKKVFLSLGFAANPSLLLLDEPTNSLDSTSKDVLKSVIAKRKSGTIIVTHDNCFDSIPHKTYVVENGGVYNEKCSYASNL